MASKRIGKPMIARGFEFHISENRSDWIRIPGISSVTITPGGADTTDVSLIEQTESITGLPGNDALEIEIGSTVVNSSYYKLLRKVYESQNPPWVRMGFTQVPLTLFGPSASGSTLAIAANATAVTKAGTDHPTEGILKRFGSGAGLAIANDNTGTVQNYRRFTPPEDFDDIDDLVLDEAPASAVSADVYSVVQVPYHYADFQADVTSFGRESYGTDGALTQTIGFAPGIILPAPVDGVMERA